MQFLLFFLEPLGDVEVVRFIGNVERLSNTPRLYIVCSEELIISDLTQFSELILKQFLVKTGS